MKAVLRQTGLKPDTLRAWERRYQAVVPTRSSSGRRVYSETEVIRLKILCELVASGQAIGSIAKLKHSELLKLSTSSRSNQFQANPSDLSSNQVSKLLSALEKFNLSQLKLEFARVRYLMSPQVFAFQLIPHLMHLVGQQIVQNKISVSQEHALSELIRSYLHQIYEDIAPIDGNISPTQLLLLTTREGDHHDIGIMLVAILCRMQGFRTQYLGPNMPVQALSEASRKLKPIAVVLGLSFLPSEEEKVVPQKYLDQLEKILPSEIGVWCGGSASHEVKRPKTKREFLIFESIDSLSEKLKLR